MTRYYVIYDHIREYAEWNEPEGLRWKTEKGLLAVIDAETEAEARKAVMEDVEFTDKNKIISASTVPPKGMEFLNDKPLGFYKAVPKSERPKFA